jgi:hypothetical protein
MPKAGDIPQGLMVKVLIETGLNIYGDFEL